MTRGKRKNVAWQDKGFYHFGEEFKDYTTTQVKLTPKEYNKNVEVIRRSRKDYNIGGKLRYKGRVYTVIAD